MVKKKYVTVYDTDKYFITRVGGLILLNVAVTFVLWLGFYLYDKI